MNCDYTSPGGTPLERLAQQQAGTHPAPCARSCEANAYEIQIRQLSSERDAMAAKLKDAEHDRDEFRRVMNGFAEKMAELEGQEPVAWVEVVSTHEGPYNFEGMALLGKGNHLLYARPVPAEQPVNARLLDVATGKTPHLYEGRCPDYVNGPESRDPDCPACQAIVSADAQQERLLQDMHDAGREIDRVMAEAAPKAPQVDFEAIARAIWNVRREEEDRCDMELEDMRRDHSVWEEASEVASILKDAGIEVAE